MAAFGILVQCLMQYRPHDGKFLLRTNGGGTYNLKVTNRYGGGRPAVGDQYFMPEAGYDDLPVQLKKEERLKGVKLKINKFTMTEPDNKGRPDSLSGQ